VVVDAGRKPSLVVRGRCRTVKLLYLPAVPMPSLDVKRQLIVVGWVMLSPGGTELGSGSFPGHQVHRATCVTTEETPSPIRHPICTEIASPVFPSVFSSRCPRASRKAIASAEKTARFTTAAAIIDARITV
jgi:hypothetical protein